MTARSIVSSAPEPSALRSIASPRPPRLVNAPCVTDNGDWVVMPSATVLLMLVWASSKLVRAGVAGGLFMVIPVLGYLSSDAVSVFTCPGSRTKPPQSPARGAGQMPDSLGTNTEPQLGIPGVCCLRLVTRAALALNPPPLTVMVPPRTGA